MSSTHKTVGIIVAIALVLSAIPMSASAGESLSFDVHVCEAAKGVQALDRFLEIYSRQ